MIGEPLRFAINAQTPVFVLIQTAVIAVGSPGTELEFAL